MAPLNVGLMGYGFSTKSFHLPFILPNPDLKVYAFLQRSPAPILADPNIDIVIVCTHHDTHAEFAEKTLLAGKHVSTEEADRVIAASKKSDRILTVFQNRRYDFDFRTLHHLVKNSAFGKITGFYRNLRGVESEIDDSFTIVLQYDGEQKNLLVTVKTTVVSTMQYPLKFFVRGYDGSFVKFRDDKQESQIAKGLTTASEGFGVETEATYGLLTTKEKFDDSQKVDEGSGKWVGKYPSLKGDYEGFYRDLVKAIRGEGELVVRPEVSRDGIRIIELARESAEKGCAVSFT